jgi:predicted nucleic acid-binding protein
MKKVFLDVNILVDLIADRAPFSKFAVQLFSSAEEQKIKLFTSSHSIATTYYLLKKYIDDKQLREVLLNLLDYVQIIAIDQDTIKRGLLSKHKDFEDAIQIISASSINNMDYIVTRNLKDFKHSDVPVYPPDEVIKLI